MDLDSAMVSGLMEAIELYHAEHIALPLKLGPLAEIDVLHRVVDVNRLPLVAGSLFSPDLAMLWIEGLDLLSGETCWVPFESVHTNFILPRPPGSGCFDNSSNGLAAGSSYEEALCHAICEIIERDATALWNRLDAVQRSRTGLDLDSIDDARCLDVLARLEQAEFGVSVWETTSDVGIPAFFSLIRDLRDPTNHHGIGAAAHPARSVALLKSLIEAVQVRTTYITGARDDLSPDEYSAKGRASKRAAAKRLLAGHKPLRRMVNNIADHAFATATERLHFLLDRLRTAGTGEVVAVDLSKEDLGIPVVRVIVPGLEGPDDHAGYVPGERARRAKAT
jgi:ribosomal protein S12 methylthiotransferase accessory factor